MGEPLMYEHFDEIIKEVEMHQPSLKVRSLRLSDSVTGGKTEVEI